MPCCDRFLRINAGAKDAMGREVGAAATSSSRYSASGASRWTRRRASSPARSRSSGWASADRASVRTAFTRCGSLIRLGLSISSSTRTPSAVSSTETPRRPVASSKRILTGVTRRWRRAAAWASGRHASRPLPSTSSSSSWCERANGHPEELELVLGSGLLAWRPDAHAAVRRHLLVTPVKILFDDATGARRLRGRDRGRRSRRLETQEPTIRSE